MGRAKTKRKMDILNKVNEFRKYRGGSFALYQKHLVAFKALQCVLLWCWSFWNERVERVSQRGHLRDWDLPLSWVNDQSLSPASTFLPQICGY